VNKDGVKEGLKGDLGPPREWNYEGGAGVKEGLKGDLGPPREWNYEGGAGVKEGLKGDLGPPVSIYHSFVTIALISENQ
jgi:hypothetical protein